MNILVTGGTGLIGRHFIRHYGQYHYTVISRNLTRASSVLPSSVTLLESLNSLSDLDAFDAVINLAGEPIADKRWTQKQKNVIEKSRWHTTSRLVELFSASQAPPKVFISGSAIGYYDQEGSRVWLEESQTDNQSFAQLLCSKWEDLALEASPYTRVVHLRTGIVLDKKQGALAKMITPFKLGLGAQIGGGQQYMSWIHRQDMIRAMHFLLINSCCFGPFNLVSPTPVTNRHFSQALAEVLHRKIFFSIPATMLKLLMGESASLLLGSQRVAPKALEDAGFKFEYPTLEECLDSLLNE